MADSFFTSVSQYDAQVVYFNEVQSQLVIEAATRRLVHLKGPLKTSSLHYRLGDICAGAYVLPVEHWTKHSEQEPQQPRPNEIVPIAKKPRSTLASILAGTDWWIGFLAGLAIGFIIWGLPPH